MLAGIRSSRAEIDTLLSEGRFDEARQLELSHRNTSSFEEAVEARDWVEALSFRHRERDNWTAIMAGWLREHDLSRAELRDLALTVWLGATPVPVGDALGLYDWADIWTATGYYSNRGCRKPRHGLIVYRGGAIDEHGAKGMSWTPNIKLARVFALIRHGHTLGAVYQVFVEPAAILAILGVESYVPETIEMWKTIGEPVEVIVHPDATVGARRVETTSTSLPFTPRVRGRNLGDGFLQEFRNV